MIKGYNDKIATKPFETQSIEGKINSGFAVVHQKHSLTPLTVVYGNNRIQPGSTIWVRSDACKLPWANDVFEIDGNKIILVPEEFVMLIK